MSFLPPAPPPVCVELQQVEWVALAFAGKKSDLVAALAELRAQKSTIRVGVSGTATSPKSILLQAPQDTPYKQIAGAVFIAQAHHLKMRAYYSYPPLCNALLDN